jgi:hypothetical protein
VKASLYDFQTYAAAGQTSLSFFQVPTGQGGKTIADTNMKLAGQLSAGNVFVVEGIEVLFFPGVLPMTVGAAAAATNFTNDVYTVAKSGSLRLKVLDKDYVEEAPIGRFPPRSGLDVRSALAIDVVEATEEAQLAMDYARFSGAPYAVAPAVTLDSTMSFDVTMTWPALVALPSSAAGRIGVVLNGIMYRKSQ